MRRGVHPILIALWLLCAVCSTTRAQDDRDKKAVRPDVSAEDRARVMMFAKEHHPELARLLEQLEKPRPGEFARAMRELNSQIERLDKMREKTPARYEEQLSSWKDESQIRVLMARWSRNRSPELEQQIRELLARRHEARVARLQADQKRFESQLAKVNEQLAALPESTAAQVDQEWTVLITKAAPAKKSSDQKAGKGQSGEVESKASSGSEAERK